MFWFLTALLTIAYLGGIFGGSHIGLSSGSVGWMTPVFLGSLAIIYFLCGINIIREWKRRPVLFFGRYVRTAGPGFCWIDPALHTILNDVRVQDTVNDFKVENVQTNDNVRLHVLGVITTRISPERVRDYVVEVDDAESATMQRAIATVTEQVGLKDLDHILHHRTDFSKEVQRSLTEKIAHWGFDVKAVEIKDFKIADLDIERSIAMKARALKEAEAELKRAEMQKQIAEKLKEAAHVLDESAWKLKGLETLIELCRSAQNNTILIPTDFMKMIPQLMPTISKA